MYEAAFHELAILSQNSNRNLADLAEEVLWRGQPRPASPSTPVQPGPFIPGAPSVSSLRPTYAPSRASPNPESGQHVYPGHRRHPPPSVRTLQRTLAPGVNEFTNIRLHPPR